MIFMCGVENLCWKTEAETIRMWCEHRELFIEYDKKVEPLRLLFNELDLDINKEQNLYGAQYNEIIVSFKCYKSQGDSIGKTALSFSSFFKGASATYVFPIDEFLSANKDEQKEMILKGIKESLMAIKRKKKGDFNAIKLIADLTAAIMR